MIWSLIPDWLMTLAAAGITGFVALLVGQWRGERKGQSQANAEADKRQAQGYTDTRKRADEVEISDDTGLLRDSLRARDPRKP